MLDIVLLVVVSVVFIIGIIFLAVPGFWQSVKRFFGKSEYTKVNGEPTSGNGPRF